MITRKPRILVMAPDLPYPRRAGGQMRMMSIVPALASCGTVHVACLADRVPPETVEWMGRLGGTISSRPASTGTFRRLADRVGILLTGHNLRYRADEARFFHAEMPRVSPDLVWLETPYLLRYAMAWHGRVPLVVDYWGTSQGAERDYRAATGSRRIWRWFQWRAAVNGERLFLPKLSVAVTVSRQDADYFHGLGPSARIMPVPMGVEQSPAPAGSVPKPGLMVFTGDLSFGPNVDAAVFFVGDVLPRIRARNPGARVVLAGRTPAPAVQALAASPGVELRVDVSSLAACIAEAELYVLPMRLGSGVRTKLFEVFPLGKAIVTTRMGTEGLELGDRVNCLLADSAGDFAGACIELLADADLRQRLGQAARRLGETVYSARRVEESVREVVQSALGLSGMARRDGNG